MKILGSHGENSYVISRARDGWLKITTGLGAAGGPKGQSIVPPFLEADARVGHIFNVHPKCFRSPSGAASFAGSR